MFTRSFLVFCNWLTSPLSPAFSSLVLAYQTVYERSQTNGEVELKQYKTACSAVLLQAEDAFGFHFTPASDAAPQPSLAFTYFGSLSVDDVQKQENAEAEGSAAAPDSADTDSNTGTENATVTEADADADAEPESKRQKVGEA